MLMVLHHEILFTFFFFIFPFPFSRTTRKVRYGLTLSARKRLIPCYLCVLMLSTVARLSFWGHGVSPILLSPLRKSWAKSENLQSNFISLRGAWDVGEIELFPVTKALSLRRIVEPKGVAGKEIKGGYVMTLEMRPGLWSHEPNVECLLVISFCPRFSYSLMRRNSFPPLLFERLFFPSSHHYVINFQLFILSVAGNVEPGDKPKLVLSYGQLSFHVSWTRQIFLVNNCTTWRSLQINQLTLALGSTFCMVQRSCKRLCGVRIKKPHLVKLSVVFPPLVVEINGCPRFTPQIVMLTCDRELRLISAACES
jgi:hypothetical protein